MTLNSKLSFFFWVLNIHVVHTYICFENYVPLVSWHPYFYNTIRQNSVWTMHGRVQTNIVRQTLFNSDDLFY
jgi:hypothetical protein